MSTTQMSDTINGEYLSIEESLKQYPYLLRLADRTVFITKNQDYKYKIGEQLLINGKKVSKQLLIDIVTSERYYEIAQKLFKNEIDSFRACCVINGEISSGYDLSKSDIVTGLDRIINENRDTLSGIAFKRYQNLKEEISYKKFLSKNQYNNYYISIEGCIYSISIKEIMALLNKTSEEFDTICSSSSIENINGIKKEYFLYAIVNFFKENNLFAKYQFPLSIKEKVLALYSMQKVDIEAINQITVISDPNINEVEINPELKTAILAEMPETASEIEKAVYIYIKMCKLLTYDEEFYAVDQNIEVAHRHEDVKHIKEITPQNNRVVCYEFNSIYAKLLEEIGLKFTTDQTLIIGYGGGHANLKFRSGKFLVEADAVASILQGDLIHAKLNQPIDGLDCENQNEQTQEEFEKIKEKMYNLIIEQEKAREGYIPIKYPETFEEILREYKKNTTQEVEISLAEKLEIMMQKIKECQLVGIDSLSYLLQLRKIIFNKAEKIFNIKITLIKDNDNVSSHQVATTSAIISINTSSNIGTIGEIYYYLYNPNTTFYAISREELQDRFNKGIYGYIPGPTPEIPGIKRGGIKK